MAVYFLNAEFNYPQTIIDEVITAVQKYLGFVTKDLLIKNPFDVVVYPNHYWTEDTGGVDGHAQSGGFLLLRIDLRDEKYRIKDLLGSPLKAVVVHEANHVARWQGPGYGFSLLEATVSEGLATVYEKMNSKGHEIPHADYSNLEEFLGKYRTRDKNDDATYNHNSWFFGFDPKYPKFLGYKVGTYIIDEALKNNPKISIQQMTTMKAEEIIKLSGIEL